MPLLPFWSGKMLFVHENEEGIKNTVSNANVQNYFNQVKHRIIKSQTHLKIGRFINKLVCNWRNGSV